jgi:uncharacterized Fe-S cluster-containing protein
MKDFDIEKYFQNKHLKKDTQPDKKEAEELSDLDQDITDPSKTNQQDKDIE